MKQWKRCETELSRYVNHQANVTNAKRGECVLLSQITRAAADFEWGGRGRVT